MKLLVSRSLETLSKSLSVWSGKTGVEARVESYSCKLTGSEKAFYKRFTAEGGAAEELQALCPPDGSYSRSLSADEGESPALCDAISRKTLFYLIATLNAAFPDYDFSMTKSCEFTSIHLLKIVQREVSAFMGPVVGANWHQLCSDLWNAIDQEVTLSDCVIYSYNPDLATDPFGEPGCIWAFNYFFYNKKMKRIVFFTSRFISMINAVDVDFLFAMDEDEEYY